MRAAIESGSVRAVYSDQWFSFLSQLGCASIERATDVEFDNDQQTWIARERSTGDTISSGTDRAQCIRDEVTYLENKLCHT